MGDLLKEIQILFPKAADALKQAGFVTDSDIQSLTREDLHELLPGRKDLRLRKDVFDKIKKSKPANMPLEELRELLNNLASSAQIDPGIFIAHVRFINEQLINVLQLCNDNVDLMKNNTMQQDSKAEEGNLSTRAGHQPGEQEDLDNKDASETSPSPAMVSSPHLGGSQGVSGSEGTCNPSRDTNAGTSAHDSQEATVQYKMVVGGQTFGAHTQLMERLNEATIGVTFLENSQDSQIIIVFCPITSHIESDVKAAMTGVPGDKPVILVKMHHVCESKASLCFNTSIDDRNDVLQVNVFYHENIRGLLKCQLNDKAVSEIQQELLKHSDHRSKDTSPSSSGWGLLNYFWGVNDNNLVPNETTE